MLLLELVMIFLAVVANRNNKIDHRVVESDEQVVVLLAMVVGLWF